MLLQALLAMTPGDVARAALLSPDEGQRRLRDFAAAIPVYRKRSGVRSFSSGKVAQVPDENLVALQKRFSGRAQP